MNKTEHNKNLSYCIAIRLTLETIHTAAVNTTENLKITHYLQSKLSRF